MSRDVFMSVAMLLVAAIAGLPLEALFTLSRVETA